MLWSGPERHGCISELRLLTNSNDQRGTGRHEFVDIFIPGSSQCPLLELKNASLNELWRGQNGKEFASDTESDPEKLRNSLREESVDALLKRGVAYSQRKGTDWEWVETTINDLKQEASDQVGCYINTVQKTQANRADEGACDPRVLCDPGTCEVIGYVAICVGGTRVLAWKVMAGNAKCEFTRVSNCKM